MSDDGKDKPSETASNQNNDASNEQPQPPQSSMFIKLSQLFKSNMLDAAAWCIRIYIVLLSIFYILLGGAIPSVDANYKKVLIANALVACIRLHQRMNGNFALSRAHMEMVLREDSAHYLVFSIIFLMQPVKITMALMPIAIMATVHAVKYAFKVLDTINVSTGRNLLNYVAAKQQILFRLVALTEIFLMPTLIIMAIMGRGQILSPFLYYRYIKLRYSSQRNAYCRQVFYELRMTADQYRTSPNTPGILKKAIGAVQNGCMKLGSS